MPCRGVAEGFHNECSRFLNRMHGPCKGHVDACYSDAVAWGRSKHETTSIFLQASHDERASAGSLTAQGTSQLYTKTQDAKTSTPTSQKQSSTALITQDAPLGLPSSKDEGVKRKRSSRKRLWINRGTSSSVSRTCYIEVAHSGAPGFLSSLGFLRSHAASSLTISAVQR